MRRDVHTEAQGRWAGILLALKILDRKALTGKHGECPICHGGPKSESFRFDDKERRGTWICTHCGAGNGVDLVMRAKGVDFTEAKEMILREAGAAELQAPKAGGVNPEALKREMTALWTSAYPLDGKDLASRYVLAREPGLRRMPASLKFVPELPYKEDGDVRRLLPAMIGKFSAPDGKSAHLHRTWIREPGLKADVAKPRRMYPGLIPPGGAIRLWPLEEHLGIAEGIETAVSAAVKYDLPVWAATGANELIKFVPPPEVKALVIFADSDPSFTGQMAAYALANRLRTVAPDKRIVVEVQLTRFRDTGANEDFNDESVRCAAA